MGRFQMKWERDEFHDAMRQALDVPEGEDDEREVVLALAKRGLLVGVRHYRNVVGGHDPNPIGTVLKWARIAGVRVVFEPSGTRFEVAKKEAA